MPMIMARMVKMRPGPLNVIWRIEGWLKHIEPDWFSGRCATTRVAVCRTRGICKILARMATRLAVGDRCDRLGRRWARGPDTCHIL